MQTFYTTRQSPTKLQNSNSHVMKNYQLLSIFYKRRYRLIHVYFMIVIMAVFSLFIRPLRNLLLHPVLPKAWHPMETIDVLRIHYWTKYPPPQGYLNIFCATYTEPTVCKRDLNTSSMLWYEEFSSDEKLQEVLQRGHGLFLPSMSHSRKINTMYLFLVITSAFKTAEIKFFLVAGSLLGRERHRGFVPWDDDIDISIDLNDWVKVKQALSCIRGFQFYTTSHVWHWKFSLSNDTLSFIDLFFHDIDDKYVWALTHYTRQTFIFPRKDVFPLQKAHFEGIPVYIPYDSLAIARRIFDYDLCVVHLPHGVRNLTLISKYPDGYSIKKVPCSTLGYMYKMHHLSES